MKELPQQTAYEKNLAAFREHQRREDKRELLIGFALVVASLVLLACVCRHYIVNSGGW